MPRPRKSRKRRSQKVDLTTELQPINLHAAGIDVGSAEHYVAVPVGRDPHPVQTFGSFTADLHRLAQWLKTCRVETVVMQATGVYWIGLYEVLETYGLQVYVVNAHHTKTLPGRKTDVQECQWLQKLHTFGLLNNSFRPPEQIRALRCYLRQRENLVQQAGTCIQQMQKCLTEMNLQLANVISDLSGMTGLKIIQAILDGERNPRKLAALADLRIQATPKEIIQSLEGHWREECLFVLDQVHEMYYTCLEKIRECDERIEKQLQAMTPKVDPALKPMPAEQAKNRLPRRKHIPQFDLRGELYRITGVDLTQIDGVNVQTAQVVISEVGVDMSRWRTEAHFASWLGLCPNNEITGGKVIRRRTRKVRNRATVALRVAAQTLHHSKTALGAKYRRFRARLGAPKAITAMAHHLACLIYRMLRFGTEYHDKGMQHYEQKYRQTQIKWLQKQAAALNMQLVAGQPLPQ
jgi:transposase